MKDGNPHWGKTFECAVLKMGYLPVPAPGCMSLLGKDGRRKSHPKSVIHTQLLLRFPMCRQPSFHVLITIFLMCARAHFDACSLSPWWLMGCRLLWMGLSWGTLDAEAGFSACGHTQVTLFDVQLCDSLLWLQS